MQKLLVKTDCYYNESDGNEGHNLQNSNIEVDRFKKGIIEKNGFKYKTRKSQICEIQ